MQIEGEKLFHFQFDWLLVNKGASFIMKNQLKQWGKKGFETLQYILEYFLHLINKQRVYKYNNLTNIRKSNLIIYCKKKKLKFFLGFEGPIKGGNLRLLTWKPKNNKVIFLDLGLKLVKIGTLQKWKIFF